MNPAAYNLTYELRSALETQILKDLTLRTTLHTVGANHG